MNSFGARGKLAVAGQEVTIHRLAPLADRFDLDRLPFSIKILLENLLRCEDGVAVQAEDVEAVAGWQADAEPSQEIAFSPARVLMQDFTGVPAVVDLAAMRAAMVAMKGDPKKINPQVPAELVIDHSVQVDAYGNPEAFARNTELEFERNRERYAFLRWGQTAFDNFVAVPPGAGIVHQINLEHLARVVFLHRGPDGDSAYPDTLVGTDSHTTMINGVGVLGWGVGGIEAEAAMLGQPVSMLLPQVVGFELTGSLAPGATATDLVLTVTQMLRQKGVVGKFVEFHGSGLDQLSLADRATIANMAPEYGATCGLFPIDEETLRYLALTGRSEKQIALVEAYAREQGMFRTASTPTANYTDGLKLDMGEVVPSLAGPKRPQDRIALRDSKPSYRAALETMRSGGATATATAPVKVQTARGEGEIGDGSVVIAAITSCTNTSNPAVMVAAGLLARKARARGLDAKPWVKTSLAPGSKVVTEYLRQSELLPDLEAIGFHVVGYGCTTCIGNSGPLPESVQAAIKEHELVVCSVLSGNRNFEGRVHASVKMNFLASPPLVVAYALAGTMDLDLEQEPLGHDQSGAAVFLRDVWPTAAEVREVLGVIERSMFTRSYADVRNGDDQWRALEVPDGDLYAWENSSTYIREAPFFTDMPEQPAAVGDLQGARVLALLGDSVTTDHISPAGSFAADTPAGRYLQERGVGPRDFNSYGSRRGNHEVMMRGTFANVRLRNRLAPGTEGGFTAHLPGGEVQTIFEASMRYQEAGRAT